MISQKAKYALRALVALARTHGRDDARLISEIAEQQRIPKKFLEQILLDLKHHGIVSSRRGKAGGYMLLKSPDAITFGEVMASSTARSPRCRAWAMWPIAAARTAATRRVAKSARFSPVSRPRRGRFSTA